jgi:hypothetical protein
MTSTSSRDWDAFNLERRDRRNRQTEQKKARPPKTASANWVKRRRRRLRAAERELKEILEETIASNGRIEIQLEKNAAGLFVCPKCTAEIPGGSEIERHFRRLHGFMFH